MSIQITGVYYFYRYPKSVTGKKTGINTAEFTETVIMYPDIPKGENAIFCYNPENKTYLIFKDGNFYAGETVGKRKFEKISGMKV